MNYKNNEMLTSPYLSYTSRDYKSIYNELKKSIPTLTKVWNPDVDTDPGVVLLKLISMLGDMLSYNLDKRALEAYPRTVKERDNARQLFKLIGYKMGWWKSSKVNVSFSNSNSFKVTFDRYSSFVSNNGIVYTNLKEFDILPGTYTMNDYNIELIQGTPVTPPYSNKSIDNSSEWHDIYAYNIDIKDIKENKIYLKYSNIDEDNIVLIDNDETPFASKEWRLVKNINLETSKEKIFEFDVDESGNPYILLPSYWNVNYVINKFKIFLIQSLGSNGEIKANCLKFANTSKIKTESSLDRTEILKNISIYNTPSSIGHNPESCEEGRINSEKYINTLDTLVVLRDYENATKRIENVVNSIATDIYNDPYLEDMRENEINLLVVRNDAFETCGSNYIYNETPDENIDDLFKENILSELSNYKIMTSDINIKLENMIDWINWTVSGQLFLRKPITNEENHDLMIRINNNLYARFNTRTLDFNEPINYMDVIECIMATDTNIWHVDLNSSAIEYKKPVRKNNGDKTGYTIKNQYKIYKRNLDGSNADYTGYYFKSMGCSKVQLQNVQKYTDIITPEQYLAGTGELDLVKNVEVILEDTVVPGGSGRNANVTNKIIPDTGCDLIGNLFGENSVHEYEIYNKMIYDWTGKEPVFTGYMIDFENDMFVIKNVKNRNAIETIYNIEFNSNMYDRDDLPANRYLVQSQMIIESIDSKELRDIYIIMDSETNQPTSEIIDVLTGLIYINRNGKYYKSKRMFDEASGNILNTYGFVQYNTNMNVEYKKSCKEDITGEYIQQLYIGENQKEFDIWLGQDENGNKLLDSVGSEIEGFPIKPNSVYIYLNGDEELLADNGYGNIQGTPGAMDSNGAIDYETGHLLFNLTKVPSSVKIIYTINKITYATYTQFDTNTFFVKPEYIKNADAK